MIEVLYAHITIIAVICLSIFNVIAFFAKFHWIETNLLEILVLIVLLMRTSFSLFDSIFFIRFIRIILRLLWIYAWWVISQLLSWWVFEFIVNDALWYTRVLEHPSNQDSHVNNHHKYMDQFEGHANLSEDLGHIHKIDSSN